jgi:2,4-dienoyl-CoA reductase-like NADH-dependent reductase (Old Yellow Enzyme family)
VAFITATRIRRNKMSQPALFSSIEVGGNKLQTRVVLTTLTRYRAHDDHTPSNLAAMYYEQRASYPGTLLISKATFISPQAGIYPQVPGLWTDSHIAGWREISRRVHDKNSCLFIQLWDLGKAVPPGFLEEKGLPYVFASDVNIPRKVSSTNPLRPLTKTEIRDHVGYFATAARNAVNAGANGVEIHVSGPRKAYSPIRCIQQLLEHDVQDLSPPIEDRRIPPGRNSASMSRERNGCDSMQTSRFTSEKG